MCLFCIFQRSKINDSEEKTGHSGIDSKLFHNSPTTKGDNPHFSEIPPLNLLKTGNVNKIISFAIHTTSIILRIKIDLERY
jgi:hypothetical protein